MPGERVDQKVYTDTNRALVQEGKTPAEGEVFRNPQLAETYRRIAKDGRDGFYVFTVGGNQPRLFAAADDVECRPSQQRLRLHRPQPRRLHP